MVRAALVVLGLGAAAVFGPAQAAPQKPAAFQVTPEGETKQRLSPEARAKLVERPMQLATAGKWAEAQAAFEKLVAQQARRHGPDSIEVSDVVSAFVIGLFAADMQDRAYAYAPRMMDAAKRAWGSDHLEYALVLNDVVSMDEVMHRDAVSLQAEPALREVYRIRRERLGPKHKETIATLVHLGRIQGFRSRTEGELKKAAPAFATLRRAINQAEEAGAPATEIQLWARRALAETYARNGALQPALQAFARRDELRRTFSASFDVGAASFADALEEGGFKAEAAAVRAEWTAGLTRAICEPPAKDLTAFCKALAERPAQP